MLRHQTAGKLRRRSRISDIILIPVWLGLVSSVTIVLVLDLGLCAGLEAMRGFILGILFDLPNEQQCFLDFIHFGHWEAIGHL
jgi:hypothetical protein